MPIGVHYKKQAGGYFKEGTGLGLSNLIIFGGIFSRFLSGDYTG
jgi:hypothetical protein